MGGWSAWCHSKSIVKTGGQGMDAADIDANGGPDIKYAFDRHGHVKGASSVQFQAPLSMSVDGADGVAMLRQSRPFKVGGHDVEQALFHLPEAGDNIAVSSPLQIPVVSTSDSGSPSVSSVISSTMSTPMIVMKGHVAVGAETGELQGGITTPAQSETDDVGIPGNQSVRVNADSATLLPSSLSLPRPPAHMETPDTSVGSAQQSSNSKLRKSPRAEDADQSKAQIGVYTPPTYEKLLSDAKRRGEADWDQQRDQERERERELERKRDKEREPERQSEPFEWQRCASHAHLCRLRSRTGCSAHARTHVHACMTTARTHAHSDTHLST
ncbi:MAG: hypothetical protein ACPIOQ_69420, partial [Promethearchaeia archaeon]